MGYHARLGPSGAYRWSSCTASPAKQDGLPNTSNPAARIGTVCHAISEEVVRDGADPNAYVGRQMHFWRHDDSDSTFEAWAGGGDEDRFMQGCEIEFTETVTEEMVEKVTVATDFVKQIIATRGGSVFVEQAVSIGWFTGEEGATGSADVIILVGNLLIVIDFKYGRHKVYASELQPDGSRRINLQLGSYGLGALHDFEMFHDQEITEVMAIIVQPYVNHVSEFTCTVGELRKVEVFLRDAAERTRTDPVFVPDFESCHFCRAKNGCQARRAVVYKAALDGFGDEPVEGYLEQPVTLVEQYQKVAFVRDWCKGIEEAAMAAAERNELTGYKLVEGKKGDRTWANPAAVEAELTRMRLKKEDMYTSKLVSPTQLADSKVLGKTQLNKVLANNVTRADGKPVIAPMDDPRPAIGGGRLSESDFNFDA